MSCTEIDKKTMPFLNVGDEYALLANPKITQKTWGYEKTYINQEYCCKLLHFDEGSTSMHFHIKKHETLVVISGVLTMDYIYNKQRFTIKLNPGDAWIVARGFPHKLQALDGPVDLIEASTYDYPEDSIRIEA